MHNQFPLFTPIRVLLASLAQQIKKWMLLLRTQSFFSLESVQASIPKKKCVEALVHSYQQNKRLIHNINNCWRIRI